MVRIYDDLAEWWPLLSSPSDYREEAEFYYAALAEAVEGPLRELLELGCGGGNNASHLKARVRMTLVDLSPAMLAVSRRLNPECEHVEGDMRLLQLGREFDAVFAHDAVMYMTTEQDLRRAMATARAHCRPGGAALFAPDWVRETSRLGVRLEGHEGEGRALRYPGWMWDPDPADPTYVCDSALLLREGDRVRVEHDHHVMGLFPRDRWQPLLRDVGFEPCMVPFKHSVEGELELFVGRRRS